MPITSGYPMVLEMRDRLAVIVGGGSVGMRKAQGLLASGATRVRVVSPTFHPEMPAQVQRVGEPYRSDHLAGASLVFAATDSAEVNEAVVRDAHAIGALVCRADGDEQYAGDFATPAMLRQGPLLLTVSSGGSPALSAMIRDRLAGAIDPGWIKLAQAMQELRPVLLRSLSPARKKEAFRALCSDEALAELSRGGTDALRTWLAKSFNELSESD